MAPLRAISRTSLFALALAVSAPAAAQQAPEDLILEARSAGDACAYDEAAVLVRNALEGLTPQQGGLGLVGLQDAATYANALGEHQQALAFAEQALELAERAQPERGQAWARIAQNKAVALSGLGRFAEADLLFEQVLALADAASAEDLALSATIAAARNAVRGSRPQFAERLSERLDALAGISDAAPGLRAEALTEAGNIYRRMLRFSDAERALLDAKSVLGDADNPRMDLTLALLEAERGDLGSALDRASAVEVPEISACDPFLAVDRQYLLGNIRMLRREVPEAIATFGLAMRDLELAEQYDRVRAAEITYGLAIASSMGREFDQASDLFDRAAELYREVYGRPTEPEVQVQLERALMLVDADSAALAMFVAEEALALLEQEEIEVRPLTLAYARATLGLAAHAAGEWSTAEAQLTSALTAFSSARGESFDLAPGLLALAEIAAERGDFDEAEAHVQRALEIYREAGGDSALGTGMSLSRLASVASLSGDTQRSLAYSQQAIDVLQQRLAVGERNAWNDAENERRAGGDIVANELRLVSQECSINTTDECEERLFAAIQLASATRASASVTRLANRLENTDRQLSSLLRERTDLADEWRTIQDFLIGGFARNASEGQEDARLQLIARLPVIEQRIAAIDETIRQRNPQLDLLLKTRVVNRDEVSASLADGEAFLGVAVEEDQSYVTVLHQGVHSTYAVPVSSAEIDRLTRAIRLSIEPDSAEILYDFDLSAARQLFELLFEPALPLLETTDRLAYVADGSLASLPLAVLLTGEHDADLPYAQQPWLGRRFVVRTFPSATSLVALRSLDTTMPAARGFLGIGDPDFGGGATAAAPRDDLVTSLTRSRIADVELIRAFAPLPASRREIEAIASNFPASNSRILLGSAATESEVRAMNLAEYDTIAFATHAVVAGEIEGYAEPAIILTPPDVPTGSNDGMLSASEITDLQLAARLLILSACNTAADNGDLNAEPLSGLAQAFFYAGARSLLVSHWEVESNSTAELTARLVELQNDGVDISRGLQMVMEEFLAVPDNSRDHPFYWAPFVIIG